MDTDAWLGRVTLSVTTPLLDLPGYREGDADSRAEHLQNRLPGYLGKLTRAPAGGWQVNAEVTAMLVTFDADGFLTLARSPHAVDALRRFTLRRFLPEVVGLGGFLPGLPHEALEAVVTPFQPG